MFGGTCLTSVLMPASRAILLVALFAMGCRDPSEPATVEMQGGSNASDTFNEELHSAIREGHLEIVRRLVENGADLEPTCDPHHNCKPLGYAIFSRQWRIAEYLVEAGADLNGIGAYSDPPLTKALERSDSAEGRDMVRHLIEAGADVNQPNAFGVSPFVGTCGSGDVELLKLMIDHGALVNDVFPNRTSTKDAGRTCLHRAVTAGDADAVTLLVEHGADPELMDAAGTTPRSLAEEAERTDLLDALASGTSSSPRS